MNLQGSFVDALKIAVKDNDLQSFKKLCSKKDYIEFTKTTNPITLACQYGRENFLKYILNNDKVLSELSMSPHDKDETGHTAVYYSIRSGNLKLLETLINNWPNNYFTVHPTALDDTLSEAYQELKLRNVTLTEEMESFVQKKLINLRFFSNDQNSSQNSGNLSCDIEPLKMLMTEHIELLSKIEKVDEKFLFIAKRIAQNIHVLKRKLKCTYDKLPWEEVEFCLLSFVTSYAKMEEINLFYQGTIDRNRIIGHLKNFAVKLEKVVDTLDNLKTNQLICLPYAGRDKNVSQILEESPEFKDLYDDYHQIRDIHSLERIRNYVELAVRVDPTHKEGQLVILRSLQVMGEYFKNTLESPKMSTFTSERLLLTLQEDTRKIIISLRNSLSHASSLFKRINLEETSNAAFFSNVQNDMKKIGTAVEETLYKYKMKMIRILLGKLVDCENLDEMKWICMFIRKYDFQEMLVRQNFLADDFQKLECQVKKLKDCLSDCTLSPSEKGIIDKIYNIMEVHKNKPKQQKSNYATDFLSLSTSINMLFCINSMDESAMASFKYLVKERLENLSSVNTEYVDLKEIKQLSEAIFNNKNLQTQCEKFEDIQRAIFEIHHILDFDMNNINWIDKLSEELDKKTNSPDECRFSQRDFNKHLIQKISELRDILDTYKLNDSPMAPLYVDKIKLQVVLEMLILDILEILGTSEKRLENNLMLLGGDASVLVGKSLRNHLAHGNTLVDVLKLNPSITLISNAQNLVSRQMIESKQRIGKSVVKDISDVKKCFEHELLLIDNQQSMFTAIEKGDLESMKKYIEKGADIFSKSISDWTTLHFASKNENLEIVKFLIDNGVNVSCKNMDGQSPLHIAALYGSCRIVEWFLKNKHLNVDDMDASGKAPLHIAAENGYLSTVETLLEFKADIYARDRVGFTPFHYAVECDHKNIVELFLSSGHDVNKSEAPGGFTPLHIAAEHGHLDLVNFLLDRGANAHAKIDRKATALHLSASEGHLKIVNVLLSKLVEVNDQNLDGRTPLHLAVSRGHEELASILLENGADPNISDEIDWSVPLHAGAFSGNEKIVKDLLKHGAKPDAVTTSRTTPFHVAIQCGHTKIARLFLESGVDLSRNVFAGSLDISVKAGNYDMVKLLLENNLNINEEDNILKNWKLMHYAAWKGNTAIFEILLKNNANVNVKDYDNSTPLHIAASSGHEEIVKILLEKNVNVDSQDKLGSTPLHNASVNGKLDVVRLLLEYNAQVNVKNKDGLTTLHRAAMYGHKDIICCLLENGADVNEKCRKETTVLHTAAESGYKEIVNILLKNNADMNIIDIEGRTPLIYAIENSQKEIVEIFIKNGADVNADGGKPLVFAVKSKDVQIINMLLKQKAGVNTEFGGKATLLHLAIRNGDKDAARILIDKGIDVNCKANVNETLGEVTPLFLATEFGYHKLAEILLQKGADVNCEDRTGTTPLHVAVNKGFSEVVEILLKYNANIHIRDREGRKAFEFAVCRNRLECVKAFLRKENIDLNEKGTENLTVLHIATQEGLLEMVKFLVEKGANMHAKNIMNSKPIHIAARAGHKDLVKYFLDQGMDVEEPGSDSKPLLQYAVSTGQTEMVDYLLERGANINGKDCNGWTSVHVAAHRTVQDICVLRCLLEKGAFYNYVSDLQRLKPVAISEKREITALLNAIDNLFKAVKANDSAQVQRSISAGAIVNAKNSLNITPLHYAAWKGFGNIVDILLKNSANSNVAGKNGITPLHYAAQFSHLTIVKSLLMHGAIYNTLSENGKTPVMVATNQKIVELLKSIEGAFKKIEERNISLFSDLNKMDPDMKKLIMSVVNADNKTLVAYAILKKYPHIDLLKDTSVNDYADLMRAEMLRSRNNLQEALKLYKKLLKGRTNILGPNNPATLDISYEIALTLFQQQKFDESLSKLREVHDKQASILGECNEVTLNTKSKLAYLLQEKGQNDEALRLYREICAKQSELLKSDDENLMSTELHMALLLDTLGKYDEALKINRNLYEKHKKKLGAHHPNSLTPLNNTALVLMHQSNYSEALKIYQEVYEARKEILGSSHEHTMRTLRSMANVYHMQQKYDKAMKIYEDIFEKQKKLLGQGHLDTLYTQQAMARLFFDQGKLPSALRMYNDFLAVAKPSLGSDHPLVKCAEAFVSTIKMTFQGDGSSHLIDIVLKNAKK